MVSKSRNVLGLLRVYDTVLRELRDTGVLRSNNNPVGDFAEFLVAETFNWTLTTKSTKGHDARDDQGNRYEIKARRLASENGSRQLSAIRDIDGKHFDYVAGILFASDFSVFRAALIPWSIVFEKSVYVGSTNSSKLILNEIIWEMEGVSDITEQLQSVLSN